MLGCSHHVRADRRPGRGAAAPDDGAKVLAAVGARTPGSGARGPARWGSASPGRRTRPTRSWSWCRARHGREPSCRSPSTATAWERGRVAPGETCRIEGVGPVRVATARRLAEEGSTRVLERRGMDVRCAAVEARYPTCTVPDCGAGSGSRSTTRCRARRAGERRSRTSCVSAASTTRRRPTTGGGSKDASGLALGRAPSGTVPACARAMIRRDDTERN